MKEGVAAEGAHGQRHQEGEQELEAGLIEDGHQDHPQQRQQADDGDGHKAPHPGPHWRQKSTKLISTHSDPPSPSPLTRATCSLSSRGKVYQEAFQSTKPRDDTKQETFKRHFKQNPTS